MVACTVIRTTAFVTSSRKSYGVDEVVEALIFEAVSWSSKPFANFS